MRCGAGRVVVEQRGGGGASPCLPTRPRSHPSALPEQPVHALLSSVLHTLSCLFCRFCLSTHLVMPKRSDPHMDRAVAYSSYSWLPVAMPTIARSLRTRVRQRGFVVGQEAFDEATWCSRQRRRWRCALTRALIMLRGAWTTSRTPNGSTHGIGRLRGAHTRVCVIDSRGRVPSMLDLNSALCRVPENYRARVDLVSGTTECIAFSCDRYGLAEALGSHATVVSVCEVSYFLPIRPNRLRPRKIEIAARSNYIYRWTPTSNPQRLGACKARLWHVQNAQDRRRTLKWSRMAVCESFGKK